MKRKTKAKRWTETNAEANHKQKAKAKRTMVVERGFVVIG
jgi:hypothetical protein